MIEPTAAGARPRWGLVDVLVGFVAAQLLSVLAVTVVLSFQPRGTALGVALAGDAEGSTFGLVSGTSLGAFVAAQVPLWAGLIGAVVVAGELRGGGVVHDFGLELRRQDILLGGVVGVGAQVAVIVGYGLWSLLVGPLGADLPARQLAAKAEGPGIVVTVLLLVLVGPVAEELFYRGLLLRTLERLMSPAAALAVSSLVFAAVHFQVAQFAGLAVAGLAFGWLAQRSGRLGPAVAAHMAFNATTVALLLA